MQPYEIQTPKKILTPTLIALLCVLGVSLVALFFVHFIYLPNLPEYDDLGYPIVLLDLDGDGTVFEPYRIYTVEDLDEIALKIQDGARFFEVYFLLMNDIDMTEYLSPNGAGYNKGAGWLMLGSYAGAPFSGVFDGNGHVIKGVWVNRPAEFSVGFFGSITDGEVHNLRVEATSLVGRNAVGALGGDVRYSVVTDCHGTAKELSTNDTEYSTSVGGLIGDLRNSRVTNCSAELSIEYKSGVDVVTRFGGLLGAADNNSMVRNSHAKIDSTLQSSDTLLLAGGLVGLVTSNTVIDNCYAEGSITATAPKSQYVFAGGLIGAAEDDGTIIMNSYSTANVSANGLTGGLAGYVGRGATVDNCHATGFVYVTNGTHHYAGGLVGQITKSVVKNSYATGDVFAGGGYYSYAGGLIGALSGSVIETSYATGSVRGGASEVVTVGGLVGETFYHNSRDDAPPSYITNCYSTGSVFAAIGEEKHCGGFIGYLSNNSVITNCYSSGYSLSGDLGDNSLNNPLRIGFAGSQYGIIESSFFHFYADKGVNFTGENAQGEPLSLNHLNLQDREIFEGWDFVNVWFVPDEGFPQLRVFG
ncbi:MAG: hypothetical protein FWH20_06875 [Oscillospiraceae bacterium]|nr:hypothetical protein [Oscillospiraceae bacterium]